jgi:leucyl aminopeptidase
MKKINLKLKKLFTSKEVTGRYKEFTILHSDNFEADRILIMGLGKRKDLTTEKLRAVMAVAARNIRRINLSQMTVVEGFQDWNLSSEESACAIVEGIQLGLYKFRKHQSGEQKKL